MAEKAGVSYFGVNDAGNKLKLVGLWTLLVSIQFVPVPSSTISGMSSAATLLVKVKTQIDAVNWKEVVSWFDGMS